MAEKNESHIDRVWEVMAKAGICMMVTRFVGGLRARPLKARPERDTETIWFLTDGTHVLVATLICSDAPSEEQLQAVWETVHALNLVPA